eukprot:m.1341449 g.1341449  ORF g.1341449 m.1341449 type:complete len:473 (+) comp24895_c0_seq6:1441-2859(+)
MKDPPSLIVGSSMGAPCSHGGREELVTVLGEQCWVFLLCTGASVRARAGSGAQLCRLSICRLQPLLHLGSGLALAFQRLLQPLNLCRQPGGAVRCGGGRLGAGGGRHLRLELSMRLDQRHVLGVADARGLARAVGSVPLTARPTTLSLLPQLLKLKRQRDLGVFAGQPTARLALELVPHPCHGCIHATGADGFCPRRHLSKLQFQRLNACVLVQQLLAQRFGSASSGIGIGGGGFCSRTISGRRRRRRMCVLATGTTRRVCSGVVCVHQHGIHSLQLLCQRRLLALHLGDELTILCSLRACGIEVGGELCRAGLEALHVALPPLVRLPLRAVAAGGDRSPTLGGCCRRIGHIPPARLEHPDALAQRSELSERCCSGGAVGFGSVELLLQAQHRCTELIVGRVAGRACRLERLDRRAELRHAGTERLRLLLVAVDQLQRRRELCLGTPPLRLAVRQAFSVLLGHVLCACQRLA